MRSTTETRSTADPNARKRLSTNGSAVETPSGCDSRRWPAFRIGMAGAARIEDFNRAMIAFYHQPVARTAVTMELTDSALWRRIMAVIATNLGITATQREPIGKHEEADDDYHCVDPSENT